ncbi:MAG: hypothetical protein RIB57_17630 [Pelagibacterium sp.]|uniref:hypothetical protein n=1 Tax=Pelagibacterium sp. TaxID=1967288 RepID=UPI0032EBFE8C
MKRRLNIGRCSGPQRYFGLAGSIFLAVAVGLTLVDLLADVPTFSVVAFALTVLYILFSWFRLTLVAKVLGLIGAGLTIFLVNQRALFETLQEVSGTAMYLPSLLAVLAFLRAAATASPALEAAGRYIVNQPPGRRFAMLAMGTNVFGVLLNVGGLLMLLDIALHGRGEEDKRDDRVRAIQARRMTSAVVRGFAATLFWSPFGVGMSLGLTLLPDFSWIEFLPIGLLSSALFLLVGWVMDRLESPRSTRPASFSRSAGLHQLLAMVLHLATIILLTTSVEYGFGVSLRASILLVIPSYAIIWHVVSCLMRGMRPDTSRTVLKAGFVEWNKIANEIGILLASSYIGLVLAEFVPSGLLADLASCFGLTGGVLACLISVSIVILSIIGLNPMITAIIIMASMSTMEVALLPSSMLVLSILLGWATAMLLSPMTATIIIAARLAGRPVLEVGLRWNGATAFVVIVVFSSILIGYEFLLKYT